MSDVFTAAMLGVLREPFERWLASRGLALVQPPDVEDPDAYAVVPNALARAIYQDESPSS